jgi:hypothetical protein
MIKAVIRMVVLSLVAAVSCSVVFAETIKKKVTFTHPVVVNGTVIQEGTYSAAFDDQTNELSIIKDGEVLAKAPARLEKRKGRSHIVFIFREENGQQALVSVGIKGKDLATIVSGDPKSASTQ